MDAVAALANAYLAAKRWSEAEQALPEPIDLRWISYQGLVPWIRAHLELARLCRRLGREAEAARYLTPALRGDPGGAKLPPPQLEPQRRR